MLELPAFLRPAPGCSSTAGSLKARKGTDTAIGLRPLEPLRDLGPVLAYDGVTAASQSMRCEQSASVHG